MVLRHTLQREQEYGNDTFLSALLAIMASKRDFLPSPRSFVPGGLRGRGRRKGGREGERPPPPPRVREKGKGRIDSRREYGMRRTDEKDGRLLLLLLRIASWGGIGPGWRLRGIRQSQHPRQVIRRKSLDLQDKQGKNSTISLLHFELGVASAPNRRRSQLQAAALGMRREGQEGGRGGRRRE